MKTSHAAVGSLIAAFCACGVSAPCDAAGRVELLRGIEDQPEWAAPYGREFWRGLEIEAAEGDGSSQPDPLLSTGPRTARRPTTMDEVVDRVSHAIKPEAGGSRLMARSKAYAAWFDANSFRLSLPAANEPGGLELVTRSVTVGKNLLFDSADASRRPLQKVALCNTVQALLNSSLGLVEHVEVRGDGVALAWVLRQHALVDEELIVRFKLGGATFVCATSAGFHFLDESSGRDFLVRRAVATDRVGDRWRVAMAAESDSVVLKLPARCMLDAPRPLVIESRIEPSVSFTSGDAVRPPRVVAPTSAAAAPPARTAREDSPRADQAGIKPRPKTPAEIYAPKATTSSVDEVPMLMEMRDLLVMFQGLAWCHVNDGIPHDRDTIAAQASSWAYLADSQEERGRRNFVKFQRHVEQTQQLLNGYRDSVFSEEAARLSRTLDNFMILPFNSEGSAEANRLEEDIRRRLPAIFYGLRNRGEPHIAVFTTLRNAAKDGGHFHYCITAAGGTRTGVAADWAARLADYDIHSNEYSAVRRPLFAKNVAVARKVGELGECTDVWLESIRTGRADGEPLHMLDRKVVELCEAIRLAPLSSCGDDTVADQIARLRLAYSELMAAKLDLSSHTSPIFDAARVQKRLAAIAAKLQNARDEARKQLTTPDETTWQMLGISSTEEAKAVVKQRRELTAKFGLWLQLVQDWQAALAQHPNNNFATLNFLTSFVRNKAEWDHLMVADVYPVAWHYPPSTIRDLVVREEFRKGATVEASVNAMLADLRDVWACYGNY